MKVSMLQLPGPSPYNKERNGIPLEKRNFPMASSVSLRFNLPYIPEIVGPIAHEREDPFFEDVVEGDGGGIRLDALVLGFLLGLEAPSRASTL